MQKKEVFTGLHNTFSGELTISLTYIVNSLRLFIAFSFFRLFDVTFLAPLYKVKGATCSLLKESFKWVAFEWFWVGIKFSPKWSQIVNISLKCLLSSNMINTVYHNLLKKYTLKFFFVELDSVSHCLLHLYYINIARWQIFRLHDTTPSSSPFPKASCFGLITAVSNDHNKSS